MELILFHDTERQLPTGKNYSIVKLDTFEQSTSDDVVVKLYEVDHLGEGYTAERLVSLR